MLRLIDRQKNIHHSCSFLDKNHALSSRAEGKKLIGNKVKWRRNERTPNLMKNKLNHFHSYECEWEMKIKDKQIYKIEKKKRREIEK